MGTATWTPPLNVDTVEALIVGGGGSGGQNYVGYAGGGGDVKIVTLSNSGDVTVNVGGADTDSSTLQGTTTNTASAGVSGANGGASGNGNLGANFNGISTYAGGGAGGAASNHDGGAGITISSLSSSLFLNDSDCLGGGGATITHDYNGNLDPGQQYIWYVGESTCGGGYSWQTSDVVTMHAAIANSGGGGTSDAFVPDFLAGASGRVTLRFTLTDPVTTSTETVLAHTGSNAKPMTEFGMFLMVLGSVGYLAGRRRTKA